MDDQLNRYWEDMRIVRRLLRQRFMTVFQDDQLSPGQSEVLMVLVKHSEPMQPKQLASCLQLTPGAITQLVEGLEKAGYVHRSQSKQDRRVTLLSPSQAAAGRLERLKQHHQELAHELASQLSVEELAILRRAQRKIIDYLQQHPLSSPDDISTTTQKGTHGKN
jgi:DNA-binding MarR family transcriptional regulator